jgi:hypothetical protein
VRFEELGGRRAEVALECLREGRYVDYCGLGLRLAESVLKCTLFVTSPLDVIDSAAAERHFSIGKDALNQLLGDPQWASILAGRPQRWELLLNYYDEPVRIRLCRLDHTGKLLWDHGWPRVAV